MKWLDLHSDLTEFELKYVPEFISALEKRQGKNNAITETQIVQSYVKKNVQLTEIQVIRIINHIRLKNMLALLVNDESGYYVALNRSEIEDCMEFIRKSENYLWLVRNSLKQQLQTSYLYNDNQLNK